MRLCTDCLHLDERKAEHCPSCGGSEFARTTRRGNVVTLPAATGMPCQGCFETGHDLKLRYYRRVTAMLFVDQINATVGYFCRQCRWKHFGRNLGHTLVLGWWGIFAAAFRNTFAILTNLWALFASPVGAAGLGALNVNELRAGATESAEQRRHKEKLAE